MSKFEEYKLALSDENTSSTEKREVALSVIQENIYALYGEAFSILDSITSSDNKDFQLLYSLSFAAWVAQNPDKCTEYGYRALALVPEAVPIYKTLVMNFLTQDRFVDAFLLASACLNNTTDNDSVRGYFNLSKTLMSGARSVSFNDGDISYKFGLTCFNGQAMESSLFHLHGKFVERDELNYVKEFVGKAPVIVEIGVLVGNHTVFFLKNLEPTKIIAIDADEQSLYHARHSFDLNDGADTTVFETIHCGIGDKEEEAVIVGKSVNVSPLDNLIDEPFDFIKVDVDGWEIPFMNGARQVLLKYKPKMMIEVKKDFDIQFLDIVKDINYEVVHKIERGVDSNYFLQPISQ